MGLGCCSMLLVLLLVYVIGCLLCLVGLVDITIILIMKLRFYVCLLLSGRKRFQLFSINKILLLWFWVQFGGPLLCEKGCCEPFVTLSCMII